MLQHKVGHKMHAAFFILRHDNGAFASNWKVRSFYRCFGLHCRRLVSVLLQSRVLCKGLCYSDLISRLSCVQPNLGHGRLRLTAAISPYEYATCASAEGEAKARKFDKLAGLPQSIRNQPLVIALYRGSTIYDESTPTQSSPRITA